MEKSIIRETAEILKRLSPQNQMYFMTLVRLAGAAEIDIKNEQKGKNQPKQLNFRC